VGFCTLAAVCTPIATHLLRSSASSAQLRVRVCPTFLRIYDVVILFRGFVGDASCGVAFQEELSLWPLQEVMKTFIPRSYLNILFFFGCSDDLPHSGFRVNRLGEESDEKAHFFAHFPVFRVFSLCFEFNQTVCLS
jgi:hypothetical protein